MFYFFEWFWFLRGVEVFWGLCFYFLFGKKGCWETGVVDGGEEMVGLGEEDQIC